MLGEGGILSMNKSLLIFDTPKSCSSCQLHSDTKDGIKCNALEILVPNRSNVRAVSCPLLTLNMAQMDAILYAIRNPNIGDLKRSV